MGDIKMSARGRKRLEMLSRVKKDALITQAKASELLGIGYRHTRRVCERYGEEADRGPIVGLAAERQAAGSRKSHQKMIVKAKQSARSRKPWKPARDHPWRTYSPRSYPQPILDSAELFGATTLPAPLRRRQGRSSRGWCITPPVMVRQGEKKDISKLR